MASPSWTLDANRKLKVHSTEARFQLSMHGEPAFVDVNLIIRDGHMLCVSTGARVSTTQVANLDIPLLAPY